MDSGDDSKSFVNGFDFVLNCLELAFCWRNRYHIFFLVHSYGILILFCPIISVCCIVGVQPVFVQ
jgi:hypothetical protein